MVLARRKFGRGSSSSRNTSYSANVSFALIRDRHHSAGKSTATRNTSAEPEGSRTTLSQPVEKAYVVPDMDRAWCAASYEDVLFIHTLTSNHNSISERYPLLAVIEILADNGKPCWY